MPTDHHPHTPILDVCDLAIAYETRYGDVPAVRGVSFDIQRGETHGSAATPSPITSLIPSLIHSRCMVTSRYATPQPYGVGSSLSNTSAESTE